jgi:hypothetical protein
MDWGWNPASFEALGTVGATVFAAIAALLAVREEGRRRKDDRRKQAMLTAAWMEIDDSMANPKTGGGVGPVPIPT